MGDNYAVSADRVRLQSLIAQRDMLKGFRLGCEASSATGIDGLYVSVWRDEHEMLVDLAIEALRLRLLDNE